MDLVSLNNVLPFRGGRSRATGTLELSPLDLHEGRSWESPVRDAQPGSSTTEVKFLGLEGRKTKTRPSKRGVVVYFAVVSASLTTPRRWWGEEVKKKK